MRASTAALAASAAVLAGPALACDHRQAGLHALAAGDAQTAARLEIEIDLDPACDDAARETMRAGLAALYAAQGADATRPATQRLDALARASRFDQTWPRAKAYAEAAFAFGDYVAAGVAAQTAIDRLALGHDGGATPTQADVDALTRLAGHAAALADAPLPATTVRGAAGGLFTAAVRGFAVKEVALPITFALDSAEFDADGRSYADMLLTALLQQRPEAIVVAGHTDPTGSAAHNDALSRRRAEAVRTFLRAGGFEGRVAVEWYGETRVPDPPPGVAPGSEAHHRIARRVELRR